MKNYRLYKTADFALDDDFIKWVLEGKNDAFWKSWIEQNTDRQLIIEEAKLIVQSLKLVPAKVSEAELDEEIGKLLNAIHIPAQASVHKISSSKKWWWAAASVIVLAGIAVWAITLLNNSATGKFSYTSVTTNLKLVEQVNTSGKPVLILLPDGSMVELAPQSRISYSNDFKDSANRDVYLQGEAFFNVVKNSKQPFRVFSNEVVTKVLGTSFTVRSFDKDKIIKVTVRTGKVTVYSQERPDDKKDTHIKQQNILLTPNQEAVYLKKEKKFEKALLEKPVMIVVKVANKEMIFEETPVIKILEMLKQAYGISIVYDNDSLHSCTITADLTDESLYTKLDLICKAIDASYEIVDSEIFFHTKGCN